VEILLGITVKRCVTMTVGLQWRGYQKGAGGGVDLGEQQRRREKELDGGAGGRCLLQRPTELVGDRVLRPYAPLGVK